MEQHRLIKKKIATLLKKEGKYHIELTKLKK